MNLRALILLAWKKTETGIPPVENLYTGHDGAELANIHSEAQKKGDYIAFRKIINPSGIPMNLVVDPNPGKVVEHKPVADEKQSEVGNHPVEVRGKKKAAAEKAAS